MTNRLQRSRFFSILIAVMALHVVCQVPARAAQQLRLMHHILMDSDPGAALGTTHEHVHKHGHAHKQDAKQPKHDHRNDICATMCADFHYVVAPFFTIFDTARNMDQPSPNLPPILLDAKNLLRLPIV